ncbi:glutamyl-tRNA reductase [Haloarcula salina]|uniref:Glutamyl-tRNA reductase n=1 Tax=Haloarcula salina TaxID=1429914 RepID=A0AA41KHL1_9EURY|nr:glutamyl-tRNA reductase [Haloarcula salina]MBV0901886.1 glutamyl-tRNA reductase [Haloarcula salina]
MSVNTEQVEARPDVEEAIARIDERGAEIRAEQLERALSRLEATDELTPEQRAAVERLGDRLVEQLLAVPHESLRDAARRGDGEAVATALSLFE